MVKVKNPKVIKRANENNSCLTIGSGIEIMTKNIVFWIELVLANGNL
jgi:hypothetical protein